MNLLQTTYVNPGIVSAESSLCATIHWGSACVFWFVHSHYFHLSIKNTGAFQHSSCLDQLHWFRCPIKNTSAFHFLAFACSTITTQMCRSANPPYPTRSTLAFGREARLASEGNPMISVRRRSITRAFCEGWAGILMAEFGGGCLGWGRNWLKWLLYDH